MVVKFWIWSDNLNILYSNFFFFREVEVFEWVFDVCVLRIYVGLGMGICVEDWCDLG